MTRWPHLCGLVLACLAQSIAAPSSFFVQDHGQTREFQSSHSDARVLLPVTNTGSVTLAPRYITGAVIVRSSGDIAISQIAHELKRRLGSPVTVEARQLPLRGWALLRVAAWQDGPTGTLSPVTAEQVFLLRDIVRRLRGVRFAEVELAARHAPKFVPDDPLFSSQWHLENTGQNSGIPGYDIAAKPAWDHWRGAGVVVGVVDDGLYALHPDLAPNFNATLSTNFNGNTFDATTDDHGSRVAGIIAAAGNNALGITGVAFEAGLADIRLLGQEATDAQDAFAVLHENTRIWVKNNSWGAVDGAGTLEGPGLLMTAALQQATAVDRDGLGVIIVFAGGNGRVYGDDVNYDGYANSPCVVAVGSVTDQGEQAPFSEPGACLAVCAPSGSGSKICSGGRQSLTTTDLPGALGLNYAGAFCEIPDYDYTQNFSGTSASAALVSGVAALVLQANPALSWRDVKEIVMRSAKVVVPADSDWHTNSAGIRHNHRFGAGLLQAAPAVGMATNWIPLAATKFLSRSETELGIPVPDNTAAGITRFFSFTNANLRVETAMVRLNLPHQYFGDLAITLTSPEGTVSRLAERHTSSGTGYADWCFTSIRHWGEPARGTWRVKVADVSPTRTGTLQDLELTLTGSEPTATLEVINAGRVLRGLVRAPAPGWSYTIGASPDLETWSQIQTVRLGDDGVASFDITNPATDSLFFRARLQQ